MRCNEARFRDRVIRFGLVGGAYVAVSLCWLYGVVDRGLLEDPDWLGWTVLAAVHLAHVPFGYAMREWPGLLLPIAMIFLAIPAGYPESDYSEPSPLWLGQIFYAIVEIMLLAVGLGLRAWVDARGRRRAAYS
jgi:hypothetical protein